MFPEFAAFISKFVENSATKDLLVIFLFFPLECHHVLSPVFIMISKSNLIVFVNERDTSNLFICNCLFPVIFCEGRREEEERDRERDKERGVYCGLFSLILSFVDNSLSLE